MTDVVAGLMMASGGSMMIGAVPAMLRACGRRAVEVVAALPSTPVPPPDADLDALVASID